MSDAEYDVVIVGAGITGAMVAKTLLEQGGDKVQKVLVLEASHDGFKSCWRDSGARREIGYRFLPAVRLVRWRKRAERSLRSVRCPS